MILTQTHSEFELESWGAKRLWQEGLPAIYGAPFNYHWNPPRKSFPRKDRLAVGSGVPYYQTKLSHGLAATGAYHVSYTEHDITPGDVTLWNVNSMWDGHGMVDVTTYETLGGVWFSEIGGPFHWDPDDPEALAVAQAQARFLNAAGQLQNSTPASLAEMRDTIRMLRHPFKSAQKFFEDHIRRSSMPRTNGTRGLTVGSTRRAQDLWQAFSDSWLETQLGLRPLMADVNSILNQLATGGERSQTALLVGSGEGEVGGTSPMTEAYISAHIGGGLAQITRVASKKVKIVYKQKIAIDKGPLPVAYDLGFSMDNVIPTLWELIPYSFVVDYFTNIGALLAASPAATSKRLYSVYDHTTIEKMSVSSSVISDPRVFSGKSWGGMGSIGSHSVTTTTFDRTDIVPDMYTLQWRLPSLTGGINTGVLAAKALLDQASIASSRNRAWAFNSG